MTPKDQMRKGSTEILILSLLAAGPMYGYQISQQLEKRSDGYFKMNQGLLYPALHRMQQNGWLTAYWQTIEGRRRKYYALTPLGREVLGVQSAEWKTFLEQLHSLLRTNEQWSS
jgi:PadR family transcriptional regulator PadR